MPKTSPRVPHSLAAPVLDHAAAAPDRAAVRLGERAVAYGALAAGIRRVAAAVAALPGPAPRVGICQGNGPAFVESFFGIVAVGGTAVLLDPKWSAGQTGHALATAGPVRIADGASWPPAGGDDAPEPGPVDPATPFLIGFTSGTTGRPKAFIRDQASWFATLEASRVEFAIGPGDGVLVPGPLVHGLGLYGAVEALCAGASVHLLDGFDAAAALDAMERHALTTLVAVPTMLVKILEAAAERGTVLPAMRRVISSGAKLSPLVHERLAGAFPNAGVFEYYGASELSFVSVMASREGGPADSVGRPFHGVTVELRGDGGAPVPAGAVGQVWVRSAMLCSGYIGGTGDGAGFRADDGWGTVGDRGWFDADGWLHLIGREGDMLISGGLNIYPAEVEAVLRAHPLVAEAVVTGLPDPLWGDVVTAVLWWRGPERAGAESLRAWVRGRLEAYKTPRRLFAAADTPLTGSGKIARAVVKGWARDGSPLLAEIP